MKIAILGFGTVGSGVYEIAKTLKNIEVKKVLEKDLKQVLEEEFLVLQVFKKFVV